MNLLFGWHDEDAPADVSRTLATRLGTEHARGGELRIRQQGPWLLAGDGESRDAAGGAILAVGPDGGRLADSAVLENGSAPAGIGGQFAGAGISDGQLVIAVDRFASIPVFYFGSGTTTLFSTDLHLLLAHPALSSARVDPQSLFDYLFFSVVPGHLCAYAGVHKLAPAHLLRVAGQRREAHCYWLPDFSRRVKQDVRDLERRVVDRLEDAVGRAAALPQAGCFLSGGLDSSSVCALAARKLGPGVRAFTIGFDEADFDESRYAAITAERFALDWRNETISADDIQTRIDEVVAGYAEPFGNASAVSVLICAQIAAAQGVENMLAGDGGDELFAGNERYQKQQLFEAYPRLPGWLRRLAIDPCGTVAGKAAWGPLAKVGSYARQAQVPLPDRLFAYNLLARNAPEKVLTPEFLAQIDTDSPYAYAREIFAAPIDADPLDRMLFLDWNLTLADNDLPKVRATCAIAGLQVHFPMLDAGVVDTSLEVPSRQKLGPFALRRFYKRAFGGVLPRQIIDKPKHGFGVPVGRWFEKSPELGDRLRAALASLRTRGIVRADFIDELLRLQRSEHAVYYGALNWTLFMLEEWLAHYRPSV